MPTATIPRWAVTIWTIAAILFCISASMRLITDFPSWPRNAEANARDAISSAAARGNLQESSIRSLLLGRTLAYTSVPKYYGPDGAGGTIQFDFDSPAGLRIGDGNIGWFLTAKMRSTESSKLIAMTPGYSVTVVGTVSNVSTKADHDGTIVSIVLGDAVFR